ncbi:hypothetical protein Tco_1487735, partial [Tanacetum coccineum]
VLDLKKKKDAQAVEILKLKKRVKGLERQRKSSTSQLRRRKYRHVESSDDDLNEEDASKQGRSSDKTEPMLLILNGDDPIQVTTNEKGVETEVPPKTAQALLARQRKRKAKIILLLAIPDEYQLRLHAIKDAKTLWAALKSRFGGNIESKKM